jgi:hypothetical protein
MNVLLLHFPWMRARAHNFSNTLRYLPIKNSLTYSFACILHITYRICVYVYLRTSLTAFLCNFEDIKFVYSTSNVVTRHIRQRLSVSRGTSPCAIIFFSSFPHSFLTFSISRYTSNVGVKMRVFCISRAHFPIKIRFGKVTWPGSKRIGRDSDTEYPLDDSDGPQSRDVGYIHIINFVVHLTRFSRKSLSNKSIAWQLTSYFCR